jgi:hypothetical protein
VKHCLKWMIILIFLAVIFFTLCPDPNKFINSNAVVVSVFNNNGINLRTASILYLKQGSSISSSLKMCPTIKMFGRGFISEVVLVNAFGIMSATSGIRAILLSDSTASLVSHRNSCSSMQREINEGSVLARMFSFRWVPNIYLLETWMPLSSKWTVPP